MTGPFSTKSLLLGTFALSMRTALLLSSLYAGCSADTEPTVQSPIAGSPPAVMAMSNTAAGAAGIRSAASSAGQMAQAGQLGAARPAAASGGAGAPAPAAIAGGPAAQGVAGNASASAAGSNAAPGGAGTGGVGMNVPAAGGGAGMGAAGSGSTAPTSADDPCGPDAKPITGMARAQGNGNTNLQTSGEVEFLSATSTLIVPSKPAPARGTLFLWPGLQPLKRDSQVGYGVLQPVLTWGSSCAPGTLSAADNWWISAQYVGTPPGSVSVNCKGGKVMKVEVGDKLDIEFKLNGSMWLQTIKNQRNGESVDVTIDLKGQKQQWLLHQIEVPTSTKPVDDVIFTSIVAKLSASQPNACAPNAKGTNDYYAPPRASADGKTCCISKIILRASGIKASSPDTP